MILFYLLMSDWSYGERILNSRFNANSVSVTQLLPSEPVAVEQSKSPFIGKRACGLRRNAAGLLELLLHRLRCERWVRLKQQRDNARDKWRCHAGSGFDNALWVRDQETGVIRSRIR